MGNDKHGAVAVNPEEARQQAFIDTECRWMMGELQALLERCAGRFGKHLEKVGPDSALVAKALHAGQVYGFAQWMVMQSAHPEATYDQAARLLQRLIAGSQTGLAAPTDGGIILPPGGERH